MALTTMAIVGLVFVVTLWRTEVLDDYIRWSGVPVRLQHMANLVLAVAFLVLALAADFG